MSAKRRESYLSDLIDKASDLALYGNTPLPLAYSMTGSQADDFFQSSGYKDQLQMVEFKLKANSNLFERFDSVIKGMNMIGNLLSSRRG